MKIPLVIALAALSLSACSLERWPDSLIFPTGYTNHDMTPLSSPHGYNRTTAEETADAAKAATLADSWRNGLGPVLSAVAPALDMHRPVSIISSGGASPLNTSAVNYTRDMMVKMGYLIALPSEANQSVVIHATPSPVGPDQIDLTASAARMDQIIATKSTTFAAPNQITGTSRLPGFTTYPATGQTPRDTTSYGRLN
jgi:hypothetical protein